MINANDKNDGHGFFDLSSKIDYVCDVSNSISYKFKNNVMHIGMDGSFIISEIAKDRRYLELFETALFIDGEDKVFEEFVENVKYVYSVKINNVVNLSHKVIQVKAEETEDTEPVEIVFTTDLTSTIKEFKLFIKNKYEKNMYILKNLRHEMDKNAYIRISFSEDNIKLIPASICMYENAINIDCKSLEELDPVARVHVITNIRFYENMIHQLNNIKEKKADELVVHAIFYDLVTYCVGLKLEVYKDDLEYKKLIHHFPCVINPKKYQNLSDEEYLLKSNQFKEIYTKMLKIREENKELIDFYSKVLYFEYTRRDVDFRSELFNCPSVLNLTGNERNVNYFEDNTTIITNLV